MAILGVPLRLGSSVIGVLFAANRTERPFAREEVALLVSLAAHAAVAIDTARLLTETQAALAELSAANTVIQAHSESVERAAAAHDRMTALVLRGGGVDDVAADLVDVLDGAVLVLDAQRPGTGHRQVARAAPRTCRNWTRRRSPRRSPPPAARAAACAAASCSSPRWSPAPTTSAPWCSTPRGRWPARTSGSWNGPPRSPRCCCCSGAPWRRPRARSAASCSTT